MSPSIVQRTGDTVRGVLRRPPWRLSRDGHDPETGAFGQPPDRATIDLQRRRDQLNARVAELQWDLGGLVYEMAIRDRIRVDVIVRRAAELQNIDAELSEVERILRLEETSTAGQCASCGAPHSSGAAYCWQCGQPLLQEVHHEKIGAPAPDAVGGPATAPLKPS